MDFAEPRTLIIFGASFLLLLLFIHSIYRNRESIQESIREFLFPPRRHAQLNRVICTSCNRGKGVYNPVLRVIDGEEYIQGTCSTCGAKVLARLKG